MSGIIKFEFKPNLGFIVLILMYTQFSTICEWNYLIISFFYNKVFGTLKQNFIFNSNLCKWINFSPVLLWVWITDRILMVGCFWFKINISWKTSQNWQENIDKTCQSLTNYSESILCVPHKQKSWSKENKFLTRSH